GHYRLAAGLQMHSGKGRAKQQDQRRVVDPHQDQYNGARGPINRGRRRVAQIGGDAITPQREQQRGQQRTGQNVPPAQRDVRQHLEDGGEEQRDHSQREQHFCPFRQQRTDGDIGVGKVQKAAQSHPQQQ